MGMAADWLLVIKSTAQMCESEAKKHEAEFEEGFNLPPLDPADQVCHPKYIYSLLCTVMGNLQVGEAKEVVILIFELKICFLLLQNCPSKYYTDSKDCNDLKEFFKTCDI